MVISGKELIQTIAIDITEKKQLEEKLVQAGKLEAVGTLAGGIAHDFNNILAAIIGYSELGKMAVGKDNPVWAEINEILKAGNRAKDIVRQILMFSRKDNPENTVIDPGSALDNAWNLLRSAIPSTVKLEKHKSREISGIFSNTTQIYQILLNLITNAAQAMEETGGTVKVGIRNTERNGGKYVLISVSDTGKGLDPETEDRIFDPYFTTKEIGRGSGLGLAVVNGIVNENSGFIEVDNRPGEGVTFNIFFPASDEVFQESETEVTDTKKGSETVLVVDDEPALVDVMCKILESENYKVIKSTDGIEALEIFERRKDEIDLVITDQTMPEITGIELAGKIKKIKNLPVKIATGYSTGINNEKIEEYSIDEVLIKPVKRVDLLKSVRDVFDKIN